MYPDIKYSDLYDHDLLPHVPTSGMVVDGRPKRLNWRRFMDDLTLYALTNPADRTLRAFIIGRHRGIVHSFQSCRPASRYQSRSKAKR